MNRRHAFPILLMSVAALALSACASLTAGPVGNTAVPQPAKPVDLKRYLGLWYELARYDNRFERDCEGVTAEYRARDDGGIQVINSCHTDRPDGPLKIADGHAKVIPDAENAKLKVSFFGPFYGDYGVLDHADDYSWSIVGEPSGRYLWLLSRSAKPSAAVRATLQSRITQLGYNTRLLRQTQH
jgi:apolipoprotein D and lipocalin family protein